MGINAFVIVSVNTRNADFIGLCVSHKISGTSARRVFAPELRASLQNTLTGHAVLMGSC